MYKSIDEKVTFECGKSSRNLKTFEKQHPKELQTEYKNIKVRERKQQNIQTKAQNQDTNEQNQILKKQNTLTNQQYLAKSRLTQQKQDICLETKKINQQNQTPFKKVNSSQSTKPRSIAKMVERFVESLSNINDSGAFDASFEIKRIPDTPQRLLRHRCVTELDRECLARFVSDFEARQLKQNQQQSERPCRRNSSSSARNQTPKGSPYLCRKAKEFYQNVFNSGNTSAQSSRSNSPRAPQMSCRASTPDSQSTHSDHGYAEGQTQADELPVNVTKVAQTSSCSRFQRSQSERSSYRSAAKVLQFFSGKKKCKPNKVEEDATTAASRSSTTSPLPMRATSLGCQPLPHSDVEDNNEETYCFAGKHDDDDDGADFVVEAEAEDEHDDGISSAGSNITQSSSSRNYSPDSSFELHPPLVPTFKVTPPQLCNSNRCNPAYEFARFLRGSFHAKRASVTKLRRSISDPDTFQQQDFTQPQPEYRRSKSNSKNLKGSKSAEATRGVAEATLISKAKMSANVICNPNLPANASPFRRAWGQSSFRTPRTDKHAHHHQQHQLQLQQQSGQHQHLSPLVRRASSMTASDNDVYIKSMHHGGYHDELKQARSQHQIATAAAALVAARNANTGVAIAAPQTSTNAANNGGSCTGQLKVPQLKTTNVSATDNGVTGVAAWGTAFERLLEDPAGMHTFAEFLKKEFSAENIYFWTACERFRALESSVERATQAMTIFSKHLANGALEPVNVDSQARNLTQEKLESADTDLFAPAQKQIFNLMKFDSYQRFIRSDMYKSCLEAEEKRQQLPYKAEDLDELLRTSAHQAVTVSSVVSKLKKSASNAEDRCRKSLLPWHRKTSSNKAPREPADGCADSKTSNNKLALLSSHSLKVAPTQNSQSDIHSSRSSLSSFDGLTGASILPGTCRVILSDASTTMVQARPNETVGQLVERLLEKRGLTYQYYDVVAKGTTKSIDMQSSSQTLIGKDVLIEQRVAFKMDLPDRKVISVKSKPKKQLHEVVRPILHKYNYDIEAVQVVLRETQEPVDLSLTVTHADGQRLQAVWLKPPPLLLSGDYQNGNGCAAKVAKPSASVKSVSFPCTVKQVNGGIVRNTNGNGLAVASLSSHPTQSALDEITNKVFTELMQVKVEAASAEKPLAAVNSKANDLASLKSEDCASETSSIFERIRRRDTNIAGLKLKLKKRSTSSQHSEETNQSSHTTASNGQLSAPIASATTLDVKKPIIAKLKAGVKLQMPERVAENQDELLEGLKRAQLARLEDQRGTEINFELPDFLKNKENLNASKLRKARANLSSISKSYNATTHPTPAHTSITPTLATTEELPSPQLERPQPAPRLSITNKLKATTPVSPVKPEEEPPALPNSLEGHQSQSTNTSNSSLEAEYATATLAAAAAATAGSCKGPPPLPPKPKVLPIKPSNWGAAAAASMTTSSTTTSPTTPSMALPSLPMATPKNYTTIGLSTGATAMAEDATMLLHAASKYCTSNEIAPRKTHLSIASEQPTSARCAYLEEPSSSFV
ncbi:regulator of G-protein signaling loco isoform X2 [Anastrepha ludens]|uniref:regulator of G-protein signaling loco isoform X2 n=1 Tax=Anastrepha ludens TaxID=28586 RepID=UPI0023B10F44|nr:regulator of G-protein signaling loco isoform X2 [Anastrepha ludens]